MKTVLIANRGEIAVRIIKTAKRLGYTTAAVFSEPDRHALFVKLADRAFCIGGRAPSESYLCIDKIIAAARTLTADAVHPGYGFLSENADFAEACLSSNLVFIGPNPHSIRSMGNKSRAKELMQAAGVPCLPGYQGQCQDIEFLTQKGAEIGFPLMVKAANGGGGRGLRLASNADELETHLLSARAEAQSAFGSGELLLERALIDARHVEVQIFADNHGNVVHLGERDCSIQRRHQKVFEESPSPAVSDELRKKMGEAAIAAARAINYSGAGTVEFLLEQDRFYFLEMNTRLQVEHPVTELVTGLDLVEWQLLVAEGGHLPFNQDMIRLNGHALEARLCAEDPDNNFFPQIGNVSLWQPPPEQIARCDHGLNDKDYVSPYYDSMLAKVIASGPDRRTAARRLRQALADCHILGLKTNREFLLHCLDSDQFLAGRTDTGFISRVWQPASLSTETIDFHLLSMVAVLLSSDGIWSGSELAGWSTSGVLRSLLKLSFNDSALVDVSLEFIGPGKWRVSAENNQCTLTYIPSDFPHERQFLIESVLHSIRFSYTEGKKLHAVSGKFSYFVEDVTFKAKPASGGPSNGHVIAPSNGVVAAIHTQAGESIEKDAPICTIEAMKLLQVVVAPAAGVVSELCVCPGQQVKGRQLLAVIESLSQENEGGRQIDYRLKAEVHLK